MGSDLTPDRSMRALVFEGPGRVELRSVAIPHLDAGQSLVKVYAAGICGSETEAYLGLSQRRVGPLILGHEIAGEIVNGDGPIAVGTRVVVNPLIGCGTCDDCANGDVQRCALLTLVSADVPGGHAEYVMCPNDNLVIIPSQMEFGLAALAEPAAIAIHAVGDRVQHGDRLLVLGCGAIGLFALQLALARGGRVDVADPIPQRRSVAMRMGARDIEPEHLARDHYDLVIDTVGSQRSRDAALIAARSGATIILVGLRDDRGPFAFSTLVRREISLIGTYGYRPDALMAAVSDLAEGRLAADFAAHVPLEAGPEAFDMAARRPEQVTKVVLHPAEDPRRHEGAWTRPAPS